MDSGFYEKSKAGNPGVLELLDQRVVEILRADNQRWPIPPEPCALLLVEVDGTAASIEALLMEAATVCEDAGAQEIVIATDERRRREIWQMRRDVSIRPVSSPRGLTGLLLRRLTCRNGPADTRAPTMANCAALRSAVDLLRQAAQFTTAEDCCPDLSASQLLGFVRFEDNDVALRHLGFGADLIAGARGEKARLPSQPKQRPSMDRFYTHGTLRVLTRAVVCAAGPRGERTQDEQRDLD